MSGESDNKHSGVPEFAAALLDALLQPQHRGNDTTNDEPCCEKHKTFGDIDISLDLAQKILSAAAAHNVITKSPSSSSSSALLPDINTVSPSLMAQRESGHPDSSSQKTTASQYLIESLYRQAFGFRQTYQGDVLNPANRPQSVPAHENCNVWITCLPEDCTETDIERAIVNTGSIFAMSLNPPGEGTGHSGTAASVAFNRISSAQAFMRHAQWEGFWVKGRRARVTWNRNRIGPQPSDSERSRVLIITGPGEVVNQTTLSEFFARYCSFRTTGIETTEQDEKDGWTTMEWRFARISGQASIAAACLRALKSEHGVKVEFTWGVDPCEELDRLG